MDLWQTTIFSFNNPGLDTSFNIFSNKCVTPFPPIFFFFLNIQGMTHDLGALQVSFIVSAASVDQGGSKSCPIC